MRKIRILCLIICILAAFCGCQGKDTGDKHSNLIIFPTAEMENTVNGYKEKLETESNESTASQKSNGTSTLPEQYTGKYIANLSTKKFHKPTCRYAINIDESKVKVYENRQDLIDEGYTPCKICKP